MKYLIKGKELKWLCTYHGLKYGKQKAPNQSTKKVGICDVCEIEATKGAQQTVLSVEDYQGIILADADGLITLHKK